MTGGRPASARVGIAVGTGLGIGRAWLLHAAHAPVPRHGLRGTRAVTAEQARYDAAIDRVRGSFDRLRQTLTGEAASDPRLILDANRELLDDVHLSARPRQIIAEQRVNAEWALWQAAAEIAAIFDRLEDAYIKARADDVRHLAQRIQDELRGAAERPGPGRDAVVVVDNLAPDEAIRLAQVPVAGIVAETGSPVSHAAILCRTFEIPAVMGVEGIAAALRGDELLVVDGGNGVVGIDPPPKVLEQARRKLTAQQRLRRRVLRETNLPAVTPDGFVVRVHANAELPDEIPQAIERGAEGIGLYRTEYLLLDRAAPPDLDEMVEHYGRVVRNAAGRPVTFRTVDIGGDKLPRAMAYAMGSNPAMGMRGIRYSLRNEGFFRAQLEAIARAGTHGPVRVLLPLVTGHNELLLARRHLREVAAAQGIEAPPLGVMIETPIAVFTADVLARDADFFSIGTNDLIQYALAIDRGDEAVAYLYSPLHLGVLRMLRQTVDVAHQAGLQVSVCGELAGDPMFTLVLLGLGVDVLSMAAAAIPRVRAIVRRTPVREAHDLVQGVLALKEPAEIERILKREMRRRHADLLGD